MLIPDIQRRIEVTVTEWDGTQNDWCTVEFHDNSMCILAYNGGERHWISDVALAELNPRIWVGFCDGCFVGRWIPIRRPTIRSI